MMALTDSAAHSWIMWKFTTVLNLITLRELCDLRELLVAIVLLLIAVSTTDWDGESVLPPLPMFSCKTMSSITSFNSEQ